MVPGWDLTQAGACAIIVKFNRVGARGRGWLLAGFEVLPVRGEVPHRGLATPELPKLALALQEPDAATEQAWDLELTSRLRA